jgi:predicted transposase YbfD/YdcC
VDEKKRSIQAARGHWSVENGNHYKRDASPWQEDRHRQNRVKIGSVLDIGYSPPSFLWRYKRWFR